MTDPISLLDLSAGPIARGMKWLTLEMRVVRRVRITLGRAGFSIDSRALRQIMYTPGFAGRLAPAPHPGDELGQSLGRVISPSTEHSVRLLRTVLTEAFEVRQAGSTPSSQFIETRDADRHREVIDAIERVERGIADGTRDDTAFEYRLTEMHPTRARAFRELRSEWPATADIVAAISTTPDLVALLIRWATYPPPALASGPPELLGVVADIAEDIPGGQRQSLASPFIERALDLGIEPRGYWRVRLAGLLGITDVGPASEFLADVRGYPLVEASLHPDGFGTAAAVLEGWDAPSRREEILRRLNLIHFYEATGRVDDAIALAKETAAEYDSTSAALLAVQSLMARHLTNRTGAHRSDLSAALLLAVDARTKRRQWRLDSGPALAAEIRVRRLLNDHRGALDIANGVGEVPATTDELRHPEVVAEIALIHADRGDIEIAKRLLAQVPSTKQPHVAAVIAEREGRTEDAIRLWGEAIDAAKEWGEKADLALQLAFQGVRSPFVDTLAEHYLDTARELTLTAALYAEQPGALEEFRAYANSSHRGALFLFVYYARRGEHALAAGVAAEAAVRWSDADMWLESARYRHRQREHAVAIEQLHSALAAAPEAWGSRRLAYGLLIEAQSALGDWQSARNSAAQLVADDPQDTSAAWALVVCEVRLHDLTAALHAWQTAGGPEPTSEMEVGAWIDLLRTFGDEIGTARDALKIAARYPGNEPIHRGLIGAFFLSDQPRTQPGDDANEPEDEQTDGVVEPDLDHAAFQELLGDYLRTYPDGPIRQVAFDADNPLESLQAIFGERPDHSDLERAIDEGTLPYGFASEVIGRTYLETLVLRSSGPIRTIAPDRAADGSAFETAHRDGAVVDVSALVTIARLPEPLRTRLAGHFANARVVGEQHADALEGARALGRDSGLSVRPGRDGEAPDIARRTPEEVAANATLGRTVEQSFGWFADDSHPQVTGIEQLADQEFSRPFLLAADHALASGLPVWVDDPVTAFLVRGLGGQAFDTAAVLRHLRDDSDIEPDLLDTADATLIAHGYAGTPYQAEIWELASGIGSDPQGLMNAIRLADGRDANERVRFAIGRMTASADDPPVLTGFVYAAAQWLLNVASSPEDGADNLRLLARDLLHRRWISSSTLPYVVNAFRATTSESAVTVLLRELYNLFEELAERVDDNTAAQVIFQLISSLDPPDAYRIRAAILARGFD